MELHNYFLAFIFLTIIANINAKTCEKKDGGKVKVGDSYSKDCDVFTCKKVKKNYKFIKSFNKTHCCKYDNKNYKVGEYFNTTTLNITCAVSELKCVNVSDFTKPAMIIDIVHHNNCCAYNHRARGPYDYFDEYYNRTMLDRYNNFTLFLEVGHNVTLPEKCMNISCQQINGMPVLSPEYIFRSCNCCYYNGSLYQNGDRNITMEDGRNASCCNGELVMPIGTNGTGSGSGSGGSSGSSQQQTEPEKLNIDPSKCWASCFKSSNTYHKAFLDIIQKLQEEQTARNTHGTCFVIDGSVSQLNDAPASLYNYERNLAILLSLTLPVNSSNPMFSVKYSNYGSCSEYHYDMQCKTDTCSAAKTLSGHGHMNVYEAIPAANLEIGMMWHGMALAHDALIDNRCSASHSNEMVVAIVNKQWIKNGLGGGNAYHPVWVGPDSLGRNVAAIGVDAALQHQLEAVSSRSDLAWRLGSDATWRSELSDLVTCLDTSCCNSDITNTGGGVPKSGSGLGPGTSIVINGTDPLTAVFTQKDAWK